MKDFIPNEWHCVNPISLKKLINDKACMESIYYFIARCHNKGWNVAKEYKIGSDEISRLAGYNIQWIDWLIACKYVERKIEWKIGDVIRSTGDDIETTWLIVSGKKSSYWDSICLSNMQKIKIGFIPSYRNMGNVQALCDKLINLFPNYTEE